MEEHRGKRGAQRPSLAAAIATEGLGRNLGDSDPAASVGDLPASTDPLSFRYCYMPFVNCFVNASGSHGTIPISI